MTDESEVPGEEPGDGEIGIMEKGGRVQFVTATGTDIHSRSPTPESSENESESATKGGSGSQYEGLKQEQQQQDQDEESYSLGSDQFDKYSDSDGRAEGEHDDQAEVSGDFNESENPKISVVAPSSSNLHPERTKSLTEQTDHLESVSPTGSITSDSHLSSSYQNDVDEQGKANQSFIKHNVCDQHKDGSEQHVQQRDNSQVESNEEYNYSSNNFEQEDGASADVAAKPPANVAIIENSTKEQEEKPTLKAASIDNLVNLPKAASTDQLVGLPKAASTSKLVDPPKTASTGKPVDPPKTGSTGKPVDPPKTASTGKQVDPPKTASTGKPVDPPQFMSEADQSEERQKCNDAAFMSWLKNKNKEIRKKRKEAYVKPTSEEEREEKRKMCDMAFNAWLVKKSKEEKEKLRNERLQNMETAQEKRYCAENTFESWLQNKVRQRRREAKTAELEQLEKAEASRIVDRAISREAYKKWMKKKREERKDEISRRLLYRKLYFSQEEQLRLSQSRRYALE